MPSTTCRTIHAGLGPIGIAIARAVLGRSDMLPVAAADPDPEKAGRSLAGLAAVERTPDVIVAAGLEQALASPADAVVHATGSYLPDVLPQLLACVRAGKNVVSTCEELAWPWARYPEMAAELNEEARRAGVSVLGTGVNPGFVLDALVLALSAASQGVRSVRAERLVDVSQRRLQLQRKVGVGLSHKEISERMESGRFGHVGLKESVWLLAAGLGWDLDSASEEVRPLIGEDGLGRGVRQTGTGVVAGDDRIVLAVEMSVGAQNPRDEIIIDGEPPMQVLLHRGLQGDLATAAVVVNAVPAVVAARPGLVTMLDLVPLRGAPEGGRHG